VTLGDQTITRTLAGLAQGTPTTEMTPAKVDRIFEALFGMAAVGFEGAAPPLAIVMDELLTEKLRLAPLWEASQTGFEEFVAAAEEHGLGRTHAAWYQLMGEAPAADDALTFPGRPRVTLWTQQPRFGEGLQEKVDILPLTSWRTTGVEPAAAWERSLTQSLHMAAVEQAMGETSTGSLLDGESLMNLAPAAVPITFEDPTWNHAASGFGASTALVVPEDGTPVAFWAVERSTGSALGILPDGSGGVDERIVAAVESNMAFFDMIDNLASMGAISGGAWLDLELAKARQVSYATLWIAYLGDDGPTPPDPTEEARRMAEEYVTGAIAGEILDALPGGWGEALGRAETVWGILEGG
jgi:hypothetical protein